MVVSDPTSAGTKKLHKTTSNKLKMEVAFQDLEFDQELENWIVNDTQQQPVGFPSEGEESASSSPSLSLVEDRFPNSPPLTDVDGSSGGNGDNSLFDSPLFDEETISGLSSPIFSATPSPMVTSANILGSPVLGDMMNLFPELGVPAPLSYTIPWTSSDSAPVNTPTTKTQDAASAPPATPHATKTRMTKRPADADADAVLDDVIIKRQKNTDAARRSRLKKVMKMEGLEKRVASLEDEKSKLFLRVAVLESEKAGLESKGIDYEKRIKTLEKQLAEAHSALTHRA